MTTLTKTTRYGTVVACSWDRLHPRLTSRAAWQEHDGELPVIEGTLIRLQVDHLPGDRNPKPLWLWCSGTSATPADVDRLWRAFLRRFDLVHTFRLFKQVLGWTAPAIRDPRAADRRTWIIIACHAQLRPPGSKNRRPAARHNVGKHRKASTANNETGKPASSRPAITGGCPSARPCRRYECDTGGDTAVRHAGRRNPDK